MSSAAYLVRQATKVAHLGRVAVAAVIARHDWAAPLAKALRGLWTDAYAVGWLSAGSALGHHGLAAKADDPTVATVTIGTDWGGWSPGDTDAAKQILGRDDALGHLLSLVDTGDAVADSIVVSRMDRLARTLIDGLEAGLAPAQIASQLQGVLGDARWAHLVALTETTRAVSAATLARYARNGVAGKEWMTAGDQHVCVPCNTNEDQGALPLDVPFADGNDAPPSHPLCRCALAPAFLTAEEAAAAGGDLTGLLPGGVSEADLAAIVTREAEDILAEAQEEAATARAAAAEAASGSEASAAALAEMSVVEVRPELVAARSAAQVGQAFMDEAERITGRRIPAEFKGSVQTAREHAEGLLRGLERFPEADLFRVEAVDLADSSYAEADGGTLRFNTAWTSDRRRYLSTLAKDTRTRWHPAGMDNPAGIALHEFGHIVDIETLGEVAHRDVLGLLDAKVDEGLASGRFRFVGSNPDVAGQRATMRGLVMRLDVSRYALDGGMHELAAEAFADAMLNGEAASRLSRDIYRVLRDRYESGGRVYTATPRVVARATSGADRRTVAELRAEAKARGLTGYSKLTKPQLLDLLANDVEGAAVARQAEIDAARNLADTLAEVHELVANGASERALRMRITARAKLTGVDVSDLLAKVGDRDALLAEADRMAAAANLTRVGEVATERVGPVPFNRRLYEILGRDVGEGRPVDIIRPGYTVRLRSGEELAVRRPVVLESERPLRVEPTKPPATEPYPLARGYRGAAARVRQTQRDEVMALVRDSGAEGRVFQGVYLEHAEPLESMGYLRREEGRFVLTDKGRAYLAMPTEAEDRAALRAAARERNRQIEAATGTERLLAEVDELLAKKTSMDVIRERLVSGLTEPGQMFAGADQKVLAALQRAADTGDLAKVRAAVTRQSTSAKLRIEAKAGTKVKFDPALHESIGGVDIAPGTQVVVVRRGASVTLPDGTVLELTKPQVRTLPKPEPRRPPAPESQRAPGRDMSAAMRQGEEWLRRAELRQQFGQGYDEVLTTLVRRQEGWTAEGRVATPAQMDRIVRSGWTEMWRGVQSWGPGRSASQIAERTRTGEWEMGHGIYGNGVYTSLRRTTAEVYRGTEFAATNFIKGDPWGPAPLYEWLPGFDTSYAPKGGLLRMALDPDAKIVDYEELKAEHIAYLQSIDFANMPDSAYKRTMYDSSAYAVSRGYDGVKIEGPMHNDGAEYPDGVANVSEPAQFIIFNRSVLIFEKASRRYDS